MNFLRPTGRLRSTRSSAVVLVDFQFALGYGYGLYYPLSTTITRTEFQNDRRVARKLVFNSRRGGSGSTEPLGLQKKMSTGRRGMGGRWLLSSKGRGGIGQLGSDLFSWSSIVGGEEVPRLRIWARWHSVEVYDFDWGVHTVLVLILFSFCFFHVCSGRCLFRAVGACYMVSGTRSYQILAGYVRSLKTVFSGSTFIDPAEP